MAYEDIVIPVAGQPISSGAFGIKVRDAILDLDLRLSLVESVLANYTTKTSNTARASTTTVTSDPDLFLPLEENGKYFVEIFGSVSGLAAADFKTQWSVPSGVTGLRRVLGPGSGAANESFGDNQLLRLGVHQFSTDVVYNMSRNASGNQMQIQEVGVVNVGATAGSVALAWAQGTSNATASTLHGDSFMRATRFG